MKARPLSTREIVGIVVLGLVICFRILGPDVTALQRPQGFPDDVVVSAQAPVNIYRDKPELRTLQLIDSINAMWTQVFAAAGDHYERPLIEAQDGKPTEGCGSQRDGWAGIYCSQGHMIVIDLTDAAQMLQLGFGSGMADDRLAYVLAHEVGHHVQWQRHQTGDLRSPEAGIKRELQAQCFAGLYGRASGRALPPEWLYADDGGHGSGPEQRRWLEAGYRTGKPAECQKIWG